MEEREIYHPCRGRDEREGEKRVGGWEAKKEAPYSSSSSSSKRGGAKKQRERGENFFPRIERDSVFVEEEQGTEERSGR